jgi:hypothetical protein
MICKDIGVQGALDLIEVLVKSELLCEIRILP